MYDDKFLIYLQNKLINLQKSLIESTPAAKSRLVKAIEEVEEIIEEYKKLSDR